MRLRKLRAFTLIELLVVISIITLVTGILLPSLQRAREQARRATCMANLRSIGQAVYVYANNNDDRLVPGDSAVTWAVWAQRTEAPTDEAPGRGEVNLGYLLAAGTLPVPRDFDSVLFCPSSVIGPGKPSKRAVSQNWGKDNARASITYMFNEALDGFGNSVVSGVGALLSHKNKINYLLSDGSVQTFNANPLIFDDTVGPELLQEVSARLGVCFPTSMLHTWFEQGEVNLTEARAFLNDPSAWANSKCSPEPPTPVLMANLANKSLVSDMIGYVAGHAVEPVGDTRRG